jgi:hypothetical protein
LFSLSLSTLDKIYLYSFANSITDSSSNLNPNRSVLNPNEQH